MPDYNFLMESRLLPGQSRVVNQLGRLAASLGLNLYLAGGAVRDLTLGLDRPRDLDFVVAGKLERLLRALSAQSRRHAPARAPGKPVAEEPIDLEVLSLKNDPRLDAAELVFADGIRAEIASARSETFTSPGRPPEVAPASIFEDLRRRDFSVNAMAISLHPNSRGLLLDPTNGAADIERRELRALYSRSFFDDPARLYRLLRLAIRMDFKPDERTALWLENALEAKVWETVREDQQGRELRAVLEEDHCGRVLKALKDRELLGGLDRKLAPARIEFDKFERIRSAIRTAGGEGARDEALVLNFLALVAKLGGGDRARLGKKILGDARILKFALGLDREAARLAKLLKGPKASRPSYVYQTLAPAPRAVALYLLVHYPEAALQVRAKALFTKFPAVRAQLPRAELEAIGQPPGAKFDQVLERIFLDELDGRLKTPQQVTKALYEYSGIKPPPPPPPPARTPPPKPAAKPSPAPAKPEPAPPPARPAAASAGKAAAKPAPVKTGRPAPGASRRAPKASKPAKHHKPVKPSAAVRPAKGAKSKPPARASKAPAKSATLKPAKPGKRR